MRSIILLLLFAFLTHSQLTPGVINEKVFQDIREVIRTHQRDNWAVVHDGTDVENFMKLEDNYNPKIILDHYLKMLKKVDEIKTFAKEYCFQILSDNRLYKRPPFLVRDIMICEDYARSNYEKYSLMKCMYERRVDILDAYLDEDNGVEKSREFLSRIPNTYSPVQHRAFSTEGDGLGFLEGASLMELTADCVFDERQVMSVYREMEKSEKYQKEQETLSSQEESCGGLDEESCQRLNAIGMLDDKKKETD